MNALMSQELSSCFSQYHTHLGAKRRRADPIVAGCIEIVKQQTYHSSVCRSIFLIHISLSGVGVCSRRSKSRPKMPLDFSDVRYWNDRFEKETKPFEWLKTPVGMLPSIEASLRLFSEDDQHILHIGPGSSTLALALRRLVSDPQRIHNVDYSQSAILLGIEMESKAFTDSSKGNMRWTCADLLDSHKVSSLMNRDLFCSQYSLIVDKSTSDAVACGTDVWLFPQIFRTSEQNPTGDDRDLKGRTDERKLHPVLLLMLHLAILASTDARWLSLSFSSERFSFLTDPKQSDWKVGVLDPRKYWTLESVIPVPVDEVSEQTDENAASVHRPQVLYWLYTMRRTSEGLALCTV